MRLLSVVGMKTSKEQRTTIVSDSELAPSSRLRWFVRLSKSIIVVGVSLLFVSSQLSNTEPVAQLSQRLTNLLSPIPHYLTMPFSWLNDIGKHFTSKNSLYEENLRLKALNDKLIRDRATFVQINKENIALRQALNVQPSLVDDITTIRLSHHIYDGYSTFFYSPNSTLDDIQKDDSVLTTSGFLVGRIVSSDGEYLKIMPLTDPSSRVPVKFENTNHHGVIAGNGSTLLGLIHVENPAAVKNGDILITSGFGGIFPPGLPVAKVTDTTRSIKCIPLGQMNDQDFVLTLSHNKPDITNVQF